MKLGQMASYVDDGLSPGVRRTLSRLQDSVPPMAPNWPRGRHGASWARRRTRRSPAGTRADRRRLDRPGAPGDHPRRPRGRGEGAVPGHRGDHRGRPRQRGPAPPDAQDDRAQPGRRRAGGELRDRVLEELDYRREAEHQRLFAAYYAGHSPSAVPAIVGELSTRRVVTSELANGVRFAELAAGPGRNATWPPRRSTGSCSGACTSCTRSTATRTRATTCSTAGPGDLPGLRAGQALHRRTSWRRCPMVRYLCVEMTPRCSAAWSGRASSSRSAAEHRESSSTWRSSTTWSRDPGR